MPEPQWTGEPPARSGYYWVRFPDSDPEWPGLCWPEYRDTRIPQTGLEWWPVRIEEPPR